MKEQMKFKNLSSQKNFSKNQDYSLKDFLKLLDPENPKFKKIESLLHGSFSSNKTGIGFDFNEIREYKIGDDLRHISWITTAKTGVLHTKEYYAEKDITSFFLIDISNSIFCGNKSEPFFKLLAFLLNLSSSFSEKIGGLLFDNEIRFHFPLTQSQLQANLIFQTMLSIYRNLNNHVPNSGSYTNLSNALGLTKRYFQKKGIIFILSDFLNLSNWEKNIYEAAQNQNIYLFQIYDPLDFTLPNTGYVTIIDPETKKLCTVNTDNKKIQETYKSLMIEKQEKLSKFLQTISIHHTTIKTTDF